MNTRLVSFSFGVALVIVCALALPAGAGAFNVANLNFQNSTLQASGHPTSTLSFERQGTDAEDIKEMNIDLPAGVFANPEAANPKCTEAQFNSDKCPATTQAGDITVTVKAAGLLDMTINGAVYVLNPDPTQTATLGVALKPDKLCILWIFCAVPEPIHLKTGATLRTFGDQGLTAAAPGTTNTATIGIPLIFWTPTLQTDITINKVQFRFYNRLGQYTTKKVCGGFLNLFCNDVTTPPSGPYFFRQTASCTPATIKVTLVSYQNVASSKSTTYTPTGCNQVPNEASIVAEPASKKGGEPTTIDFTVNTPEDDRAIQAATPKLIDVEMPKGSGLNLAGLSGVVGCTEAELRSADGCPPESWVGTANAYSKFLPGPTPSQPGLAGDVYAMSVGNQMPMVIVLNGRGNTKVLFRGVMGTRGDGQNGGDARVYSTFDQVPELPFRQVNVHIAKLAYKNPQSCGPAQTDATITSFAGVQVQSSSTYDVVDCAATPDTSIYNGPPSTSSIVSPKFWFSSTIPAGATFQCRIDSDAFTPCSSPFQSEPLNQGNHVFEVKASNGPATDPTPASYPFYTSISDFVVTPHINLSTTQARAHPDVTASIDISGGNPQSVSLRLPDGFAASLSARDLCPLADAQQGNCPASSRIGIGTVTASTFNGGSETASGSGYLTTRPTPDDVAGVMATADFSFGRITVVGGAYLVRNGKNQYLTLRDVPQSVFDGGGNETQISVTGITLELNGSDREFVTNPSQCTESSWLSTGVSWPTPSEPAKDSQIFNVPFQATGCEGLSFNPSVDQTLTNWHAGQETGVTAEMTLGHDDAGIYGMRVNEPPSLAPNYPAFGQPQDQCAPSAATDDRQFDPSVCPPQAKVGTMAIHTPLLPYLLEGNVYLIEASPIPWLGVSFDEPGIEVNLVGVTSTPKVNPSCNPLITPGGCQTQISVSFEEVPDVPIEQVDFTLDGPSRTGIGGATLSGKMLRIASPTDRSCVPSSPAKSFFDSWAGGPTVQGTESIDIEGCVD